jgi:hypothetical protein
MDNPATEADGVDTFYFGQIYDFTQDECKRRCNDEAGCMAYTQFASWYWESNFHATCVGRSTRDEIMEPDEGGTLAGIKIVAPPGKKSKILQLPSWH